MEYLANRPLAKHFASFLEGREPLLVSAIEVYVTADGDFEGLPDTVVVR